jgi:hypothetical protein
MTGVSFARTARILVAVAVALAASACSKEAAPGCPTGQTDCAGVCVDLKSDRLHCGVCTTACEAGNICDGAGKCALSCQAELLSCGGVCTDAKTSRAHCGASADCTGDAAGKACADGELCVAGSCQLSCPKDQLACGGACIDPATSRTFCGATAACAGDNAGKACGEGELCVAGSCQLSCPKGQLVCEGVCVNPATSRSFCGATADCAGDHKGKACLAGEICGGEACGTSCPAGRLQCGDTCVDPATDPAHCGAGLDCASAPGVACPAVANAVPACADSLCRVVCLPGFADCDGLAANGCETKGICSGACTFRDAEHPNYTTIAQDVALCGAHYTPTTIHDACTPDFHVCRLAEWTARFPANAAPNGPLSTWGASQATRCLGTGDWEADRPQDGQTWNENICAASDGPYNPWNDGKFLFADDGTTILEGSGNCCDWDETFAPTEATSGFAVYCCRN